MASEDWPRIRSPCERIVSEHLERAGRGSSVALATKTSLSESEIANWKAGRRNLPAWKLLEALDFLVDSGSVRVHFDA